MLKCNTETTTFEVAVASEKLRMGRSKSPGTDQTPEGMNHAGCEAIRSGIHKLTNSL
jgi:hypothetical protein